MKRQFEENRIVLDIECIPEVSYMVASLLSDNLTNLLTFFWKAYGITPTGARELENFIDELKEKSWDAISPESRRAIDLARNGDFEDDEDDEDDEDEDDEMINIGVWFGIN